MRAYAYTVIVADSKSLSEVNGVIVAHNQEEAHVSLINNGYIIRELRPARIEEITLYNLRRLKDKLNYKPKIQMTPKCKNSWKFQWNSFHDTIIWILIVILIMVLAYWRK